MVLKEIMKKPLRPIYRKFKYIKAKKVKEKQCEEFKSFLERTSSKSRIFYLGVCRESNLGDMAQYSCIQKWLKENYPDFEVFEAGSGLAEYPKFVQMLSDNIKDSDRVVFQSGYGVQDLGGNMNRMHKVIFKAMPSAKYLMLPNTIFFKSEENKRITSKVYNSAKNMLFLARDEGSYEMAQEMFPDLRVKLFPDIVTTMIGDFHFIGRRNGVVICKRNDLEQFYSNDEWDILRQDLVNKGISVDITDTVIPVDYHKILKKKEEYVMNKIKDFARHEVAITDKLHGTILALSAGTPVIVIKTTDHKVVGGMKWLKQVYPDYVYYADKLEDVLSIVLDIRRKKLNHSMSSYFKEEYYDKLKDIFEKD